MLDTHARKYVSPFIKVGANMFIKLNMTPNNVTIIGFIIGLLPFIFIYNDMPIIAAILLWVSGFLDAVDGEIARKQNCSSPWGTLMDITFDRLVELGVVFAIAFKHPNIKLELLFLTASIILSMTVFLTVGALSDNKGMKSFYYQAGVVERSEGFIMFTLMILIPKYVSAITIIFAILITITALQRLNEARNILK